MTTYTTTEGTGLVELCAVITSPQNGVVAPRPFVISVITTDDTAGRAIYTVLIVSLYVYIEYQSSVTLPHSVAPGDYAALHDLLVFDVGDRRVCHNIMIHDDNIYEGTESFLSRLLYVSGQTPIIIDPEEARVFINDDNAPELSEYTQFFSS